ncbi:MAG: hypothetical protein K9I94_01335 [Bacteroidales bacterium]|nr:hypothetical protein [Bacteroidales bacterium]
MQFNPKATYQWNVDKLEGELQQVKRRIDLYTVLRLVTFISSLVVLGYFINAGNLAVALSGFFGLLVVFGIVAGRHNRIERYKQLLQNKITVNKDELQFLDHNYVHRNDGMAFMDYEHPYLYDLDVFGKASLFQYLNRCVTAPGSQKLATWLKEPFMDKKKIEANQEACSEMIDHPEFRQQFQAEGMLLEGTGREKANLLKWLQEPFILLGKKWLPVILNVIPALTLLTFGLFIAGIIHWFMPIAFIILNLMIIGRNLNSINRNHHMLSRQASTLERYATLLSMIEDNTFKSDKLRSLQEELKHGDYTASWIIHKLSRILNRFDTRLNLLVGFLLNALVMMDLHNLYRLEKWKNKYFDDVDRWFDVIAEFDALNSLSAFGYNNHASTCFPQCNTGNFIFDAKNTGHPLIPAERRVNNDFKIEGLNKFTIITGANMAGKSTFLRTIGVNLILAMMGSPVIGSSMVFSPIRLQGRIRINDSLFENESYFFAELKKLKNIIGLLEEDEEVFVLLDEILRGTNSKDKHAGSEKFIEKLLRYKAAGIIATHDLALGELEKSYPGAITNKCFEVEIRDNQLHFDYKLKPGISQKLNASFLMKEMGITD